MGEEATLQPAICVRPRAGKLFYVRKVVLFSFSIALLYLQLILNYRAYRAVILNGTFQKCYFCSDFFPDTLHRKCNKQTENKKKEGAGGGGDVGGRTTSPSYTLGLI